MGNIIPITIIRWIEDHFLRMGRKNSINLFRPLNTGSVGATILCSHTTFRLENFNPDHDRNMFNTSKSVTKISILLVSRFIWVITCQSNIIN